MRVLIQTFGCRANQYDSEQVRSLVLAAGGEVVDSAEAADVAVYNSCAVTAEAEADLRQKVRRGARRNHQLRSVIMGCASGLEIARQDAKTGRDRPSLMSLPTVDTLVRGADLDGIANALGVPVPGRAGAQSGARGLLRIQDGCDEHCTFCATTIARGASRSRPVEALVDEAEALGASHNEIMLTGVHIGSYGADTGSCLSALVETLIARVPSVRFRLSSLEATEVDTRLIELFHHERRRLAPYLHAPLQSGSDCVLRRMGRHWYDSRSYSGAIEKIVDGHEWFGLGADVIAGFPAETEADHAETLALIETLPFTSLHVFPYSARPGTASPRLGAEVKPHDIARRGRELRAIGAAKARQYKQRRAGSLADVVVIRTADSELGRVGEGLTEDYLSVQIVDPSLERGSRFSARLSLAGEDLFACPASADAPSLTTP